MTTCPANTEIRPPQKTCPESCDQMHCPCRIKGQCCWCGDGERQMLLTGGGR